MTTEAFAASVAGHLAPLRELLERIEPDFVEVAIGEFIADNGLYFMPVSFTALETGRRLEDAAALIRQARAVLAAVVAVLTDPEGGAW